MHRRRSSRRGAATVELCVCLPLFVIVVVGTVQSCTLIHLRESLCVASYEAARLVVKDEANRQQAVGRAGRILASRGISGSTVDIQPRDLTSINPGDPVTVTVSVSAASQSYLPPQFFGRTMISGQTVMVKERD